MRIVKKVISAFIIITLVSLMPISLYMNSSNAASNVQLSLTPTPYIDVVLAKSKTSTDLTNFQSDLLTALEKQGINKNQVKISAIEAQNVNIAEGFEWQKDVSSTIGSISITNGGKNVEMRGNRTKPGKNAIWIIPGQAQEQEFNFSYNIDYGDSFNAAGMLLRVKQDGNTLTGYMLSFNNTWTSAAGGQLGAIWKFTYGIGSNSSNMTKTLLKGLSINKSGTLNVKVTDSEIEVSGGGLSSTETYTFTEEYGNGYGFFSDHYSHDCSRIGSFALTNINLKTTNVRKLEDVLREPDWREEAIKVLVNVNDVVNQQLNNPTTLGELLTRTINDEIYYTAWGQRVNKTQSEQFIKANNNNGIFINNTNYTNSINQTAQYIKSLINQRKSSEYVILNENTILSAADSSIMKNTANSQYPYGKWKVVHDCEYYENNMGQYAKSGQYISDMITSFDKTGKYEIYYEDQSTQPSVIYVHRRPVAEIDVKRNGNSVTLTSLGYDLDSYSKNRGISEEEWKYRKVGETTWTNGKLTSITSGVDYLVQLRVKDYQNTWSAPVSKYITTNNVQPIASFKIKNNNVSIYENVEVVDGSYDPYGGTITSRKWTVFKDGTQIYEGSTVLQNYLNYGTGKYTMKLQVTNNRGMSSETFSRNFTVIPDDEAPEFVATPTSCDWQSSVTVNVKFSDRLGSGFKSYQYAITNSQSTPSSWSSAIAKSTDNIKITQTGIMYIHIKAVDNAGNTSADRAVGPFKIDNVAPTGSLSHSPTNWVNTDVKIHWSVADANSGFKQIKLPDGTIKTTATGDYTVSQNGTYTFIVSDVVGNTLTLTEKITNIDKVAPTGSLSHSPTNWVNTDVKIHWSVADANSGFKQIKLPDGTIKTTATGDYTVSQNGTYTFIVYDVAGNTLTLQETVTNIDKTPPTGSLSHNPTDWVIDYVKIHWTASDSQSGFNRVVLPDGTSTTNASGDFTVTDNGTYTFTLYDNVGNSKILTENINNIDKIMPEGVLSLQENRLTDEKIKISWKAFDLQSGFSKILLPDSTFSTNATGEFIVAQMGDYSFVIYDKVGNTRELSINVSNVDMINPILEVTQDTDKWTNGEITLNWKADDYQSGLQNVILPSSENVTDKQGSYIVTENGNYIFLAYDKIGNGILVEHQVTNIDKINPNLDLTVDSADDGGIQISWVSSDEQSGISNITLPDGKRVTNSSGSIEIYENGVYSFIAYDNAGNATVKDVTIDSINNGSEIKLVLYKEAIDSTHWRIKWQITEGKDKFAYIVLPNSTFSYEPEGSHIVTGGNAEYTFLAYDKKGNENIGTIAVSY